MPAAKGTVTITILGKEYQISCPPDEEVDLRRSAEYLNDQMTQIKNRGATLGFEKVAILAALTITHQLVKASRGEAGDDADTQQHLQHLEEKIDSALAKNRQLEI